MLGRWDGPFVGWVLSETNDLTKIYEWTTQWSDLLKFTVVPILEALRWAECSANYPSCIGRNFRPIVRVETGERCQSVIAEARSKSLASVYSAHL
jgi:hypothetical protein